MPILRLADSVVDLQPLSLDHVEPLLRAASIGRESYVLTRVPATAEGMRAYVEVALEELSC
jgi:hypothetical protein